jgi:hypothetical protein
MLGQPRLGTPSYLQGWAPAIDFSDIAKVYKTRQKSCVPVSCYNDVLVTDESNPSEPGAHQRKFYAPGVGNIRVGAAGGSEKETLVLVSVAKLGPAAVAEVRTQALEVEARASVVRKDLYPLTPPAEQADFASGVAGGPRQ